MAIRSRKSFLGTLAAGLIGIFGSGAEAGEERKLLPPQTGIYHAAFPDFGPEEDIVSSRRLRSFIEETAGQRIVWAYFSDNWFDGIRFPGSHVRDIADQGSLPFIRMMTRADWQEGCRGSRYSLQKIIDGRHAMPETRPNSAARW